MENKQINRTIQFKDLSNWLKSAVIISWIVGALYGIAFIVGFIEGIMTV